MGGKSKQSQRTKNNVRPSSSSRSAELLSSGMSLDGGLVTLSSGKPLPPLFPTLATANLEQGLNPKFQMCIKKLNKKDPITRAKALHELCELVNNSDVEDVVAVLPSWAHFYKILTVDTDRKVREMTQVCHGAVVRVCGRRTAPQLKALLPAWLQAQYDDHAPAQTQAHHSLTSTFPDSKLPEVISFCKAEVMTHLLDNLNGNTEAVLSKRIESAEERELVISRIVASSLHGLQYFLLQLPRAHDAWLWERLAPLLRAAAFWKLAHATPQLRAAWYGATGGMAERYRSLFGDAFGSRTLRLLLDAATLHNAQQTPQLWTCLLQFMHNVQDWHKYLDKKELLVKRILDVLENGGWGDARHLSNMLLPLLAYLPQDILTKEFYESFFNAVFAGFEKKNILNSKSERQSWITSLAECLRYLSIQQNDFVLEIVTSVHRTWLAKVLSPQHDGQTKTNLIKCSAANMASLVKYWLKQSKEENSEKYDQLVRNFWQNIGSTVLTQIEKSGTDHNEIGKLIEGHILLLQTLKTTFSQEAKKQQSITFDGDEQTVPEKSAAVTQQYDATIVERYKHNLEDVVHKICSHYFENAEKKQVSSAILTPLITLLVEFDSSSLFMALSKQFNVDSVYKLYDKVLRTWLSGDTMRCKTVVDIVFLLMKYMTEEEQDAAFDTFQQFPPSVTEWCLSVCVRHPAVGRAGVRRWLRGGVSRATLRGLAARAHQDASAAALLRIALADSPSGELLVSEESVSEVLKTVSDTISQAHDGALEASGAVAARLATSLQDHAHAHCTPYAQLVLRLFRLNILVPRGDSRLSVDTWCEIRSSWQDGVAALPDAERKHFLRQAAAFLHEQLFQNMENLDITKIENIVSLCPHLFNRCDNTEAPNDVTEITTFTKQIFDMKDSETHAIESYALRHECVTSQLNCLYDDDNEVIKTVVRDAAKGDVKELTKIDILLYVNKHLFRAIYLRTLLLHKINADDDEEEPSEQRTWCDVLLRDEYVQREFCNVLHTYVVINSLHEGYAFWPHYDIIVQTKHKLDSLLTDVINATSQELRSNIKATLSELAVGKGYLWAYAHRWYILHADGHEEKGLLDGHKLEDIVSGNGFFHSLQASTKWSDDEEAAYKIKYLVMLRSWYTAFGDKGDEDLVRDVTRCREHCDIDVLVNAYYKHNHTMLYDKDISDCPWSEVVSNVAVVEFLTSMVTSRGWDAPAHHWDFTTITLCSLLNSLRKSMDNWGSTKVSMLSRSVLRLLAAVRQFVCAVPSDCMKREPPTHVADLVNEWKDIFAPDINYNLLSFIMHVLESCDESEMTSTRVQVVGELIACSKAVEWRALSSGARADAVSLRRVCASACAALVHAPHPAHAHLAYHVLRALAEPLVLDDAEKLQLWSEYNQMEGEEEEERPQFCLDYFHDAFTHLQEIIDAALSTVVLGEGTCEMVAMSDTYNMALSWLLLADVLAMLCQLARGDLTHHYIQIYRERGYAEPLVTSSLRLLPHEVFVYATDSTGNTPVSTAYSDMFLKIKDFSVHEAARGLDVCALACRCVYSTVCGAGGAGARGWWGAAQARAARLLERVVQAYVAPHAARQQLLHLHQRASEIADTEIRIAWSSNEVTCVYNVEERPIELRVWLARAHPLAAPTLAAPHAQGPGANTHWVSLYLAYQNGTLLNALKMWTRAVSAKVESSPQCYICYCRLHPTNGRLPRVLCYQCKNKFHNICLRKWFATSNKSNCPLCRSAF